MWPHETLDAPGVMVELYISYLRNKMSALHSRMGISEGDGGYALSMDAMPPAGADFLPTGSAS